MSFSLVLEIISHAVPYAAIRNTLHIIMTLLSYVIYITAIFLYYSRFKHSGGVCCGDFLSERDRQNEFVVKDHLIEQGLFLKWSLIGLYSSLMIFIAFKLYQNLKSDRDNTKN